MSEMVLVLKEVALHQTKKSHFNNTALIYTWEEQYLKLVEIQK